MLRTLPLLLAASLLVVGAEAARAADPTPTPGAWTTSVRDGVRIPPPPRVPTRLERATAPAAVATPLARPGACDLGLRGHWTDPFVERHVSRGGTPYVHGILTEPAFLDRALFADLGYAAKPARTEMELDAELEWAVSRRLAVVGTVPFVWWELPGQGDILDVADLGCGVRALLVETTPFLLSGGLDVNVPTSDDGDQVGANVWTLMPYLATWIDLGAWFTWQARVGGEFHLEGDETRLHFASTLAKSFRAPFFLRHGRVGHAPREHAHHPFGVFSLLAEVAGETVLRGPDEGRTRATVLLGFGHTASDALEVRAGGVFPLTDEADTDWGFFLGIGLQL